MLGRAKPPISGRVWREGPKPRGSEGPTAVGGSWGGGVALSSPARGSIGERCSGVRGGAPADERFSCILHREFVADHLCCVKRR